MNIKTFITLCVVYILCVGITLAQTNCPPGLVTIQGPTNLNIGQTGTRIRQNPLYVSNTYKGTITAVSIEKQGTQEKATTPQTTIDTSYSMRFSSPGTYILKLRLTQPSASGQTTPLHCQLQYPIHVYKQIMLYRGIETPDISEGIIENLKVKNILLPVSVTNPQASSIEIKESIKKVEPTVEASQVLFLQQDHIGLAFLALDEREKTGIILSGKKIFLLTSIDKELEKKMLTPFLTTSQRTNIYLISTQEWRNYLIDLTIGKNPSLTTITTDNLLIQNPSGYGLARVIDILIYHGISPDAVGIILCVFLCILVLIFCKHVIGLPCYGLYYPLLGAGCVLLIGGPSAGIISISGLVGYILTRQISKKVSLLVYAKMGLYIIISLLVLICIASLVMTWTSYTTYIHRSGTIRFIGIFGIFLSVRKVFGESHNPRRFKRWLHIGWYVCLVYILWYLLTNTALHQYLLIHPRLLIVCLGCVFVLGKYTHLQLVEIIRFRPLLKSRFGKLWKR